MKQDLASSVIWVPCIPNYSTGELIPMYSIDNFPQFPLCAETKPAISRGGIKSKDWDHAEDRRLMELVEELGTKQWATIAKEINKINEGNCIRKGKHCRERWYNHLNPRINSNSYIEGEWSFEEDLIILTQHKVVGNKWSKISKMLQGRTENSVKNRLNSLIKNAKQNMNSSFLTDDVLIDALIEHFRKLINKTS